MGPKPKDVDKVSEGSQEPSKKRRRTTTKPAKIFKKDFDAPPSMLLERLPSSQKTLYKSMVAPWCLQGDIDFKLLERGGE